MLILELTKYLQENVNFSMDTNQFYPAPFKFKRSSCTEFLIGGAVLHNRVLHKTELHFNNPLINKSFVNYFRYSSDDVIISNTH